MEKDCFPRGTRENDPPRIGVYSGSGSSHSFLWLADLFEGKGLERVRFLDEQEILEGPLDFDCLVFSGGAPAQMAGALGRPGADRLRQYILDGGSYVGICAGACLPLHSSREPLSFFNWINMPIANMSEKPPLPRAMPWKYMTPYGGDFVFHPVREDVLLAPSDSAQEFFRRPVIAPLYGGPPFMPPRSDGVEQWAKFAGFSRKTLFLADEDVARKVVLDRGATARAAMGKGSLLLFSPHLEHPLYPAANRVFLDALFGRRSSARAVPAGRIRPGREPARHNAAGEIRRTLSNCRVRIMGLMPLSIRWRIGQKIYEPEKAFAFVDAVWKRLPRRRSPGPIPAWSEEALESILARAREAEDLLKNLADETRDGNDATETAAGCFDALRGMTREFLNMRFMEIDP